MEIQNTTSLKTLANSRITVDLLDSSITNEQNHCPFTLLVVDNYSSKVLSSYLTMSDLLNRGIFSVELITNKRNRFPNYGVIYFISPTLKSINCLINDFADLKHPTYSRIFLYFTHRLPDSLMDKLVTEGIIKRTIFFKELNLSFFTKEDIVFDFGWESGLKIFSCDEATEEKLLQSLCDRLFTVLTTLNIHPYIQYQSNSRLCTKLSEKIEKVFNTFSFCRNFKKEGILLLTDRSIDATSPLLHDYNYRALCYDLMEVKNNTIELNNKKIVLSDEDELWHSYKLLHIAEVFHKLSKDFEDFQKSDLSKVGNTENMDSFSDMANALANVSSYKLKTSQLSNQIHLAEELNKKYKSNYIYDLIELEQDIVSGENDGGKINNRDIFKKFTITKSKLTNQREDFIRILLTLYTSLSIGEKDFNVLSGKLTDEEEAILKSLGYLGINMKNEQNKIERRKVDLIRDKVSIVGDNVSKNMNYSSLRSSPNISVIVEQASNYLLDKDKFPFRNWDKGEMPKFEKKFGTRNLFGGNDNNLTDLASMEPLIVFNIGGMSHNEIASLEKLQKNNVVNHRIYIGTTCIMNATEYLNQLKQIDRDYTKEIGIDVLDDEMIESSHHVNSMNILPEKEKIE